VLCLSTWRSAWTRVVGRGSKIRHFKRVAASSWCLWALGCDHQVYLMVHGCDVKIRVPEMVCENERWSPLGGFHSNKLNLWDPPAFSDLSGKIRRCREDVVLPSTRWVWEDDWRIQETIQGEVTETGVSCTLVRYI
jgi:tectonin beta-propeller repeat-containing protein 1